MQIVLSRASAQPPSASSALCENEAKSNHISKRDIAKTNRRAQPQCWIAGMAGGPCHQQRQAARCAQSGRPLPAVAAKLHNFERRTSCTAVMAPNRILRVSGLHCSTNES